MIRPMTCLALAIATLLAMPGPADAAESYDNCTGFVSSLPATISTQGTWCLDQDLSTAIDSGAAITVDTNNVTLDCNGFKLGGLAAGAATDAWGVVATGRFNMTVRGCNIRGFAHGIHATAGGGHLVEDSSFDGNTVYGIYMSASGSIIRDNRVMDTGGSSLSPNFTVGVYAAAGVDVLNNTVSGVAPLGPNGTPYGILLETNGDGSVNGNRVRGLASSGTGQPYGIFLLGSAGAVIRDNDVKGPGAVFAGGVGIYCSTNATTARGNVVARFETGINLCLLSSNVVNTN